MKLKGDDENVNVNPYGNDNAYSGGYLNQGSGDGYRDYVNRSDSTVNDNTNLNMESGYDDFSQIMGSGYDDFNQSMGMNMNPQGMGSNDPSSYYVNQGAGGNVQNPGNSGYNSSPYRDGGQNYVNLNSNVNQRSNINQGPNAYSGMNPGGYPNGNMNSSFANAGMGGQFGSPTPNSPYPPQPGMPQSVPPYSAGRPANYKAVKKSSMPTWLIILIVLLFIAAIGYFVFSKFFTIFGKADYIPGKYDGSTFTNEYFGIKSTFDSGWKVTNYEGGEEAEKSTLNTKTPVTEISAVNDLSLEAYAFSVEQTPYNIKEAGTDMDALMEELKGQFVNQMKSSGYEVSDIERDTITVAGKTCEGLKMNGKVNGTGMTLSLVQFYMFKGNYVGAFTAVSTSQGKSKLVINNHVSALTD